MRLLRHLRPLVLRSARPPFDAAYRLAYRAVARAAGLRLGRVPGVIAVYLGRGCAKNQIVPGISDIDLIVVAGDDAAAEQARLVCRSLGRATLGLVEYYPAMVVTRAQMQYRWQNSPAWQYRYHEGRRTWRLLAGTDVRSDLGPLEEMQRRAACYQELVRWWVTFAATTLGPTAGEDPVLRNTICYKATTEMRNVLGQLHTGVAPPSREEALVGDDSALGERLRALRTDRFLGQHEDLPGLVLPHLVELLTGLWSASVERPFWEVSGKVRQTLASPDEGAAAARICARLRGRLPRGMRGVACVGSAFFGLDERLVIVDADPMELPGIRPLDGLVEDVARATAGEPGRYRPYLRVGGIALPLAPTLPRELHRGLLTPATTPDVFLRLGHEPVYWTRYAEWYLCDHRANEQWPDASPAKRAELDGIAAGAARGHVVYPNWPGPTGDGRLP
jgi:hypothetical protein